MRVLISAWEASADRHGAWLLRELKRRHPDLQAFGAGGPELQAEGMELLVDMRESGQVMGYVPILAKLPRIFKGIAKLRRAMRERRPEFAVLIDYPGVNLKLLKSCSRYRIPGFVYIPPKVWVWKPGRVKTLSRHAHGVLTIFPFEQSYLRERGVLQTEFVGNPLVTELPMDLGRESAREKLGLTGTAAETVLAVAMAGSRPAEIAVHVERFLDVLHDARLQTVENGVPSKSWRVVLPAVHAQAAMLLRERLAKWLHAQIQENRDPNRLSGFDIEVVEDHAATYLAAADIGVIKSGTSTLEAALMRCPHVVVYQASAVLLWVMRGLLRLRGSVGLSNILIQRDPDQRLAGAYENIFPEFVDAKLDLPEITRDVLNVLRVPHVRERQAAACEFLRAQLLKHPKPFETAAQWMLDHYLMPRPEQGVVQTKLLPWLRILASQVWSAGHALRARIRRFRGQNPVRIPARVLGVGNVQVGGAGKTPLVMELARQAHERGKTVAILIRGHGGKWEDEGGRIAPAGQHVDPALAGDEATLIASQCPWAWIGVGKDRLASYRRIADRARVDVVILDDAAQNLQLHQDIEILALTSETPRSRIFRQVSRPKSPHTLNVWTKGSGAYSGAYGSIDVRTELMLEPLSSQQLNRRYWWVVGIGDPSTARPVLEKAGLKWGTQIVRESILSDHAWPTKQQMIEMIVEATDRDWVLLMSGKDWSKWSSLPEAVQARASGRIEVLEPRVHFLAGKSTWEAMCWGP